MVRVGRDRDFRQIFRQMGHPLNVPVECCAEPRNLTAEQITVFTYYKRDLPHGSTPIGRGLTRNGTV
jgi:hypothetical protein